MTVNALLAKALSTPSDEEAIAAFRMARKKNKGATVNLNMASDDTWKTKAKEYYDVAVRLKNERDKHENASKYYLDQATHYYRLMQKRDEKISELKNQIRKLENSEKKMNVEFWRIGFFVSLAIFLPIILAMGIMQ